ncbi:MAG: hypothetical protein JRI50_07300 [Deltaproteobacteria bacterium]|nr:hypothetical protein [Deltaproteobacteria bacterium]
MTKRVTFRPGLSSVAFSQEVFSHPRWRSVQLLSFLPGHSPEEDGLCLALRLK